MQCIVNAINKCTHTKALDLALVFDDNNALNTKCIWKSKRNKHAAFLEVAVSWKQLKSFKCILSFRATYGNS